MDATDGNGVKCVIDGIGLNTWEISLNSLVRLLPSPGGLPSLHSLPGNACTGHVIHIHASCMVH